MITHSLSLVYVNDLQQRDKVRMRKVPGRVVFDFLSSLDVTVARRVLSRETTVPAYCDFECKNLKIQTKPAALISDI